MVEVDDVPDRVQHREEHGCAGGDLVELDMSVQRYVLLDGKLFQLRQQVSGHGEQQDAVAEGQRSCRASRYGDSHAHDVAQICIFGHEGVV